MNSFRHADTGDFISYETVRRAMQGKPFPMSLTDPNTKAAVIESINIGIDSHLEACYVPDRGDDYKMGERRVGDRVIITSCLDCTVSVESLPILLRRLEEHRFCHDEIADAAASLQSSILDVLGIDEYGEWRPTDDE